MPKRERNLRLHIMVTHDELATIRERMKELDSHNQSAFIRKMAADGYAVNADLSLVKEPISLQRRCVNNLSQIAKYAQAHNVYQDEIMELQKGYAELWKQYSTLLEHLARLVAL
ncbi:MAG: plasmid mobilization relaxosome protein MobC [Dehalobacterium sp.]